MSYAAGVASDVPNLYAYAGGNPLTFNDPDGHTFKDPGGGGNLGNCHWGKVIGFWDADTPKRELICEEPKDPKDPKPGCKPKHSKKCGGGDDGGGGGGGGGDDRKPKRPCTTPACLAEKEREKIEQDAKTNPQDPPGNPACTNGNTSLCPFNPTQPATIVGAGDDLTDETGDYANIIYQQTSTKPAP